MKAPGPSSTTNVTYIVSDIDKALAFEWIATKLSDAIQLSFILIGKKDTALQKFLATHKVHHDVIADEDYPSHFSKSIQIMTCLRRNTPDVVHTHMWRATLMGIPVAWMLRIRKRIFTRHHAMTHYREYPSGRKWDKLVNALATNIVAISENVKTILLEKDGADKRKVQIIHHGFDLRYFQQTEPAVVDSLRKKYAVERETYPVVGVIARYLQWKGIQHIIEAFKMLRQKYPHARLILANAVGNYSTQIKDMLSTLPQSAYTEIVFEENLAALYKVFDIYVHTPVDPYSEAFGQTYVEALAAGVPSIFTLSGVASDFIRDGENAVVVKFQDPVDIERAMNYLLTHKEVCNILTANGKASVEREFSLATMLHKLEQLYLNTSR